MVPAITSTRHADPRICILSTTTHDTDPTHQPTNTVAISHH